MEIITGGIRAGKTAKRIKQIEQFFNDFAHKPISQICTETRVQCCHICEDESCGDNENPLIKKIKKLEKQLETAIDDTNLDNYGGY